LVIKVTVNIEFKLITNRSIVPVGRSYIEGKQRSSRRRPLYENVFACMHSGSGGMCHRIYAIELPSAIGYICARVCTYRTYRYTHIHRCIYRRMQDDRKFRSHSRGLHLRKGSDDLSGNIVL